MQSVRSEGRQRKMKRAFARLRGAMRHQQLLAFLVASSFLAAFPCEARLTRFVVTKRRVIAAGMSFGKVGPYERLDGTAYFEVDPRDPLNSLIVNLDRVSLNVRKRVRIQCSIPYP